ncbi:alpha-mannosidase [Paenibacillus sp. P96]|uniref:Alpha-mannosidase n=1 Tax=Paenibacillus zeirhizosphaerae TaxID=2987519 RepID=A0ABT9FRF9_9BACL|nr:alpha-mannosidase [Paenibacillus sp. P96]MDP4097320.1 alpha-mannosidase [Paenibacillus sp. P96]
MERMRRFIRELSERQWLEQQELRGWDITRAYYNVPGDYRDIEPYPQGEDLNHYPSEQGTTYFFRTRLEVPPAWQSSPFGLVFESGGEGLLRVNGRSYQGLDRNHTYVTLDPARVGMSPELEIELFDPVPEPVDPLNQQAVIQPPIMSIRSLLVRPNTAVQSLMYTVTVIRDSAALLPEADLRRVRLLAALYTAMDAFVNLNEESVRAGGSIRFIEEKLMQDVRSIGGHAEGLEHMVGQSHIDIAWLWPVRETVRKTSRTFSTVDALMNEYPEYKYAQSQPLLYAFLKEHDPELYSRVKQRIAEGRWELVGGMWVEPDLNIPSGESLMRQMLYGQRFYQEEFGMTSRIEWLPDTFGYCASLPQILKHGKVQYFMTTKLGWNDTNRFPYDLFHWVGIDGTSLLSYLNHGVNEHTHAKDIHDHWQSYREKAAHPEQMLLYGHGDGGGGVTREMLEYIDRAELMVGQPASRYSTAAEFFAGIEREQPRIPEWHGDLYLELHRGTYTTHGRNKRNNRKAEVLYREAELWNTIAWPGMRQEQQGEVYSMLHAGWKLILLNQFHDIIPGSAITESYVTSDKEYEQVFKLGQQALQEGLKALAPSIRAEEGPANATPYVVFNSLGWSRSTVIHIPVDEVADVGAAVAQPQQTKQWVALDSQGNRLKSDMEEGGVSVLVPDIPAFGYKTIWLQMVTENPVTESEAQVTLPEGDFIHTWETEWYQVSFNEQGEMTRLFDKAAEREVLKLGERANRFHFFHDRPTLWDAWDIDPRYEEQAAGEAELLESRLLLSGATKDVLRFRWRLHQSEITQDIIFYHYQRRIDFKTHVSWNENHKLLKVGFPVDVRTEKATYEIPFGTLERPTHRNTSWEQAQFEVCGHRFVDVSEYGYGVSLLNDCKYGYDVQGSTIRLSLLRAPKWPDQTADLGEHDFTYSLYPHEGDWRSAHTVRQAAELNHEATVYAVEQQESVHTGEGDDRIRIANTGSLNAGVPASTGSWLTFDGEHVVLDTVKTTEEGQGTILRFYESSGKRERISLQWPRPYEQAWLSNALEEPEESISVQDGRMELSFAPYEIKTILIR